MTDLRCIPNIAIKIISLDSSDCITSLSLNPNHMSLLTLHLKYLVLIWEAVRCPLLPSTCPLSPVTMWTCSSIAPLRQHHPPLPPPACPPPSESPAERTTPSPWPLGTRCWCDGHTTAAEPRGPRSFHLTRWEPAPAPTVTPPQRCRRGTAPGKLKVKPAKGQGDVKGGVGQRCLE